MRSGRDKGEIINVLYFANEKELKRESQEKGSKTGNARCGKVRRGGGSFKFGQCLQVMKNKPGDLTSGIFQIWSTLAGYEEQARRFKP